MAYIQCVSSFFSSRKDVFGNLLSNSKSFPCLSCARPDRGTRPDEPREAYLAALQSSSSNLNPPSSASCRPAAPPPAGASLTVICVVCIPDGSTGPSGAGRIFLSFTLVKGRPAQREISLLFVFIPPRPRPHASASRREFGSLLLLLSPCRSHKRPDLCPPHALSRPDSSSAPFSQSFS